MSSIQRQALPKIALLERYNRVGAYADCYTTRIERAVSHAEFVEAFYTTWLFKLERLILRLVAKPSTDAEARELAHGERTCFAAWTLEDRATDQLLMCDFLGNTRSWLMVAIEQRDARTITHLYFGSAIVAATDRKTGEKKLGFTFQALLGFHRLYSRALLRAARASLGRKTRENQAA